MVQLLIVCSFFLFFSGLDSSLVKCFRFCFVLVFVFPSGFGSNPAFFLLLVLVAFFVLIADHPMMKPCLLFFFSCFLAFARLPGVFFWGRGKLFCMFFVFLRTLTAPNFWWESLSFFFILPIRS